MYTSFCLYWPQSREVCFVPSCVPCSWVGLAHRAVDLVLRKSLAWGWGSRGSLFLLVGETLASPMTGLLGPFPCCPGSKEKWAQVPPGKGVRSL